MNTLDMATRVPVSFYDVKKNVAILFGQGLKMKPDLGMTPKTSNSGRSRLPSSSTLLLCDSFVVLSPATSSVPDPRLQFPLTRRVHFPSKANTHVSAQVSSASTDTETVLDVSSTSPATTRTEALDKNVSLALFELDIAKKIFNRFGEMAVSNDLQWMREYLQDLSRCLNGSVMTATSYSDQLAATEQIISSLQSARYKLVDAAPNASIWASLNKIVDPEQKFIAPARYVAQRCPTDLDLDINNFDIVNLVRGISTT